MQSVYQWHLVTTHVMAHFIPWASLAAYLHSSKRNDVRVLNGEEISDEAIVKYQEASEGSCLRFILPYFT